MRYDVIVIGAGSAGCVMASRLSEDPRTSVLLLEAGPDYPTFAHLPDDLKLGNNVWLSAYGPHNWGYVAQLTPQQNRLTIPRGKATGGSSAVNGQVLYRGIPEDYDNWASWGNTEWSYAASTAVFPQDGKRPRLWWGIPRQGRPSPSTPLSAGRVDATGRGLSPGLC